MPDHACWSCVLLNAQVAGVAWPPHIAEIDHELQYKTNKKLNTIHQTVSESYKSRYLSCLSPPMRRHICTCPRLEKEGSDFTVELLVQEKRQMSSDKQSMTICTPCIKFAWMATLGGL